MEMRHLRSFVEIVESGSFSRAAERLGITQQALSQQIANLEEELGVLLLLRSPRGVRPREAGRTLFEHGKALLRRMQQIEMDVRGAAGRIEGQVALGILITAIDRIAVPLLLEVERSYPGIAVTIKEAPSADLVGDVRHGMLDLAIVPELAGLDNLESEPLMGDDLHLAGPPGDARLAQDVPLSELDAFPLVLPPRPHSVRELVEQHLDAIGKRPRIKAEIDGLLLLKALIRQNYGYAVLTGEAIREDVARGDLAAARIVAPTVRQSLAMVNRANTPLTAAVSLVQSLIRKLASNPDSLSIAHESQAGIVSGG